MALGRLEESKSLTLVQVKVTEARMRKVQVCV